MDEGKEQRGKRREKKYWSELNDGGMEMVANKRGRMDAAFNDPSLSLSSYVRACLYMRVYVLVDAFFMRTMIPLGRS